ncbi:MAG: ABC transporter substrate-binding protein [Oscillospiraceae bacterium]
MNFKRILAAVLATFTCVSAFSACSNEKKPEKTDKIKIGVVQIVQHPSLNTIRDSFIDEMKTLGYVDGQNCIIDCQDCQNEPATANSIVQNFKGDGMDIIIAIATPTAQAAANVSDTIPVIFSAVTDPVAAEIVDSLESTGRNITGTSDALQIDQILDFALQLTPDIKKLGYIYNSGETNSVSCLEKVKEYSQKNGIEVVETAVTNSSEVQQAGQVLASKVDAIFTPNDNTIAVSMGALADLTIKAKIPLYVGADSMVKDGGFATVGINYENLGKETAKMADLILKGEKTASEIPVKVFDSDLFQYINKKTADAIGVTLPAEIGSSDRTIFLGE